MSKLDEKFTLYIKKATDILFVMNPIGTSMGILGGITLYGFLSLLSSFYEVFKKFILIGEWYYVVFGIFTFNIRQFYRKDKVPLELIEKIKFIDEQEKTNKITKGNAKMYRNKIILQYLKDVQLDAPTEKEMKRINKIN